MGGPPQKLPEPFCVQKDKEERYERLRRSKSLSLELEADLEGTDGHLYKGRIKKVILYISFHGQLHGDHDQKFKKHRA